MNNHEFQRIRKESKSTLIYLKKIEKQLFSGNKISSFFDKQFFKEFIKNNHNEEEINLMINDLELESSSSNEFYKTIFSVITPFFISFFSFVTAVTIFFFSSNIQLLSIFKELNILQKFISLDYFNSLQNFAFAWLSVYIFMIFFIYLTSVILPKNKLKYLSVLKSINFSDELKTNNLEEKEEVQIK